MDRLSAPYLPCLCCGVRDDPGFHECQKPRDDRSYATALRLVAVRSPALPTVDDASRLVTSRKYAAMGSTRGHSVEMRAGEIVNELRQIGTEHEIDEIAARVLVSTAAQRLGGRTAIEHRRGGLRPGGPALRSTYRLWMPADALLD